MAAPSAYTSEYQLAQFMVDLLAEVATVLGWDATTEAVQVAVDETLLAYGVDAITDVMGRANVRKLRTLARREAWRAVMHATVGDYHYSGGGESFSREQVHEHATAQFRMADAEASAYDGAMMVTVSRVCHVHDPYTYLEDEDRTLP